MNIPFKATQRPDRQYYEICLKLQVIDQLTRLFAV